MGSGTFNINDALNTFFIESREMLDSMESCLLELEKDSLNSESMNALFRSVHTIKGSAGMFGLEVIERFTHVVENVLDDVRNQKIPVDSDLIGLQLDCHDFIMILLDLMEKDTGSELSEEQMKKRDVLLDRLNAYIKADASSDAEASEEPTPDVGDSDPEEDSEGHVESQYWHISLRFSGEIFRNGLDPQSFVNYLGEMGQIINIVTVEEDIPDAADYDPENCYIGFEILFDGDTDKNTIENVFEFVIDDCQLRIIPPKGRIQDYVDLLDELPETSMKIGDMLLQVGSLTEVELEDALSLQDDTEESIDGRYLGQIMVEEKMVQKSVLDAALEKQQDVKKIQERKRKSIRVDADKLDKLINLIGELVITGANVKQLSEGTSDVDIAESVSSMSRLIEDVRDNTMNLRMVQIGETFKRYERVVRDLSRERGKKIDLRITGGDTELDKTLIEKISDPLMHLIRNSADHGIDMPDERITQGKPGTGTIQLNAYYETGSIVIEVKDDGNGLDRDKIFNKAVEKGLIPEGQIPSDDDIYQLIFHPGFSTADKITNISGRGVGMDVVRKNIESLRGTIFIESEEGDGTTMRIHLPLTLAIVDGFMVKVGEGYYVMPLDMVTECTEVDVSELKAKEGGNFMNLRGEVLPFMRLREFFSETGETPERENVIVLEYARTKAGLVVDTLIGEFQTVIKPLGKLFSNLRWVSGATILGTGEVALILDVPKLIQYIQMKESQSIAVSEEV